MCSPRPSNAGNIADLIVNMGRRTGRVPVFGALFQRAVRYIMFDTRLVKFKVFTSS